MRFLTSSDIQAIIQGQMSHYQSVAGTGSAITSSYGGYAPQHPQLPHPMVNDPRAPTIYGAVKTPASGAFGNEAAGIVNAGISAGDFGMGAAPIVGMAAGVGLAPRALHVLDPFSGTIGAGIAGARAGGAAGALTAGGLALAGYAALGATANWGIGQARMGVQQNQHLGSMLNIYGTRNQMPHFPGGHGISGPGQVGEIASMMRSMEGLNASFGDLGNLMQAGLQSGHFRSTQSIEQFKSKFRELVSTTKTVAKALATTQQEALSMMDSMKDMGFTSTGASAGAALLTGQAAAGAGMSVGNMANIGLQGANILRSYGGRGVHGAVASQQLASRLGAAHTGGMLSSATLLDLTGHRGAAGIGKLTGQWTQGAMNMMRGRQGRVLLGAMIDPTTGEIDPSAAAGLRAGAFSYKDLIRRFRSNMSESGMAYKIRANRQELTSQLINDAGPEALITQWASARAGLHGQADNPDVMKMMMQRMTGMGNSQIDLLQKVSGGMGELKQMAKTSWQRALDEASASQFAHDNMTWEGIKAQIKEKTIAPVERKIRDVFGGLQSGASEWLQETIQDWMGVRPATVSGRFATARRHAAFGNMAAHDRELGILPGMSGGASGIVTPGSGLGSSGLKMSGVYAGGLGLRAAGAGAKWAGSKIAAGAGLRFIGGGLARAATSMSWGGAAMSAAGRLAGGPVAAAMAAHDIVTNAPDWSEQLFFGGPATSSGLEGQAQEDFWALRKAGTGPRPQLFIGEHNRLADLKASSDYERLSPFGGALPGQMFRATSGAANYIRVGGDIKGDDSGFGLLSRYGQSQTTRWGGSYVMHKSMSPKYRDTGMALEFDPSSLVSDWDVTDQQRQQALQAINRDPAAWKAYHGGLAGGDPMRTHLAAIAAIKKTLSRAFPSQPEVAEAITGGPGGGAAAFAHLAPASPNRGIAKRLAAVGGRNTYTTAAEIDIEDVSKRIAQQAFAPKKSGGGVVAAVKAFATGPLRYAAKGKELEGVLQSAFEGDKKHAPLRRLLYDAQVMNRKQKGFDSDMEDRLMRMSHAYSAEGLNATAAWLDDLADAGTMSTDLDKALAEGQSFSYLTQKEEADKRWHDKRTLLGIQLGKAKNRDINIMLGKKGVKHLNAYLSGDDKKAEEAANDLAKLISDRYGNDPAKLGVLAKHIGKIEGSEVLVRGLKYSAIDNIMDDEKSDRKARLGFLGLIGEGSSAIDIRKYQKEIARGDLSGIGLGTFKSKLQDAFMLQGMEEADAIAQSRQAADWVQDRDSLSDKQLEELMSKLAVANSPTGDVGGTATNKNLDEAFIASMRSLIDRVDKAVGGKKGADNEPGIGEEE